jgi:hypothetical protein
MSISKTAVLAAAGIVGGGAIAGVTYAAVATPATATPSASSAISSAADGAVAAAVASPGTQPSPGASAGQGRKAGNGALGRRALLNRLEHGQLTVRTRGGDRTLDVQHGAVTAVSPTSITVKSQDGYSHSYAVNKGTRVRSGKARGSIGDVHSGDQVFVVGSAGDALRILDRS